MADLESRVEKIATLELQVQKMAAQLEDIAPKAERIQAKARKVDVLGDSEEVFSTWGRLIRRGGGSS
jgi:hypothetical protein